MLKEWLAIVNMDQGEGPRAVVIMNEDMEQPELFGSPSEIDTLRRVHVLKDFEWWAFCLTNGEVEEL